MRRKLLSDSAAAGVHQVVHVYVSHFDDIDGNLCRFHFTVCGGRGGELPHPLDSCSPQTSQLQLNLKSVMHRTYRESLKY